MSFSLSDEELALMRVQIGSAKGRRPQKGAFSTYVRDLNRADMDLILNPPNMGTTTQAVKRLRSQHHHVARLLATGIKGIEVAQATGYSVSRISILQNDPAFKELVAYYQNQSDATFIDVHAKLAGLGEAVVEELQERLEDDPNGLSPSQLIRIGEFALDRSSAPPKSRDNGVGMRKMPSIAISFVATKESQLTISADSVDEAFTEEDL